LPAGRYFAGETLTAIAAGLAKKIWEQSTAIGSFHNRETITEAKEQQSDVLLFIAASVTPAARTASSAFQPFGRDGRH